MIGMAGVGKPYDRPIGAMEMRMKPEPKIARSDYWIGDTVWRGGGQVLGRGSAATSR